MARLGSLAVLLAALALACGADPAPPPDELRVISLSPALTRILLALDAGDELVGVDRYSQRLPGVDRKPSLGGLFAPDLERAVELRPSLVLAVESAQQSLFFEQLRARGIRVETFVGHSLAEVLESYRRIGALVGREQAGRRLASDVEMQLEGLAPTTRGPAPRVAVIIERDPLYVAGGGSFVDELIRAVGARNAFADLDAAYPRVSLEALAARAPEVLLDTTYDAAHRSAAQDARAYWQRFPWATRVEVVPQGVLTLPGPDLPEAARLLRDRIRPPADQPTIGPARTHGELVPPSPS